MNLLVFVNKKDILVVVKHIVIESLKSFITFLNRLENEHLNNVGHYRAVKTVPLPFRETDSDYWDHFPHTCKVVPKEEAAKNRKGVISWTCENTHQLFHTQLKREYPVIGMQKLHLKWQLSCKLTLNLDFLFYVNIITEKIKAEKLHFWFHS